MVEMKTMEQSLKDKLGKMVLLCEQAIRQGCSRADLIMAKKLKIDERVYLKCTQNLCGHFNDNFMCPPYVTHHADWRKVLSQYQFALLCQQTILVEDGNYRAVFDEGKPQFNALMLALEQQAAREGFTLALALYAGHCEICKICALKDGESACRMPNLARPSMEAIGLNVGDVNKLAGFPDGFRTGEVTLTGLLLIG